MSFLVRTTRISQSRETIKPTAQEDLYEMSAADQVLAPLAVKVTFMFVEYGQISKFLWPFS